MSSRQGTGLFALICGTALVAPSLVACGGDDGTSPADAGSPDARLEGFDQPDDWCPGSDHCAAGDGGRLFVGAAAKIYTPEITETWTDLNGDSEWQSDEPYVDANNNGKFDAYWLFGGGRAANSVKTDLEARALVFREGDTEVALAYLDCTGLFGAGGDIDALVAGAKARVPELDHVIVGSTHAHDAVDTLGLWGATALESGYNAAYNQRVQQAAIDAIVEAAGDLHEAEAHVATQLLLNTPGDPTSLTDQWNKDIRDPVIFDPTLTIVRFARADDPTQTIGTLVNWADHPEMSAFGPDNLQISSHFPHWFRDGVEHGTPSVPPGGADEPGIGGVTVYAQGAVGGQIGSIRGAPVPGPDGTPITESSHEKDQALGVNLARRTLELLRSDETVYTDLPLTYRTVQVAARLDNIGLQVAYLVGILAPHAAVGYDPGQPLGEGNNPWLPFRATYFQIGPVGMVTMPGELHPELWVGGYDCSSWTWGYPCYDDTLPNLPDFDNAPAPPYLRDLVLANPGVEYPMLLGLAHDYFGYIVPAYNYVLDDHNPYLDEADGDHYEETYSLGPDVERHVVHPILQLVAARPGE
ncbi:MAG: hypothetical protein H6708_21610 [Kofleriaceae bacterium]|nr:hypothetical protein [Myxococcales bacterium]MCB9563011.1 hypothetical protein [Kofleriaceae bacterium]